mgnify:CR=1 FL=1
MTTRQETIATALAGITSDFYTRCAEGFDADFHRGSEARAFARHGRHGLSAVTMEETAAAMGITGSRLVPFQHGWVSQGFLP